MLRAYWKQECLFPTSQDVILGLPFELKLFYIEECIIFRLMVNIFDK